MDDERQTTEQDRPGATNQPRDEELRLVRTPSTSGTTCYAVGLLRDVRFGPDIPFPDHDTAVRWFRSPEYRAIADLRIRNSTSAVVLVDDCGEGHRATDILAASARGTSA